MTRIRPTYVLAAFMLIGLGLTGCSSSSTTASAQSLTANVGQYSAPPALRTRPRVAVPEFDVSGPSSEGTFNQSTADVATTLAFRTGRFDVVERAQLQQLLREQGLEGVVRPGELARAGEVKGVDYLLIGKVTDFRVRTERTGQGFSLANVADLVGAVDTETRNVSIRTEAGIDLRLVDPSTAEIVVANFSDFSLTDTASSVGVQILGASATSEADLQITADDKGKLLRLAIDDALRKMLPEIDQALVARDRMSAAADQQVDPGDGEAETAPPAFCPECGERALAGARFCTTCGTAIGD